MDRIVVIQGGLAITAPISTTIKKAYKYHPPASVAAPNCPCFFNSWTKTSGKRANGAMRERQFAVHMQLLVDDSDSDRASDIASAFYEQLETALDADQTLNHTVETTRPLRGGSPTLAALERAGRLYIGLDLYLDLVMTEAYTSG